MAADRPIMEDVKDAITDDSESLGKKAPGAPFAIVALSYIAILGGAMLALGVCVWLFT